jgi:hypothetical protein
MLIVIASGNKITEMQQSVFSISDVFFIHVRNKIYTSKKFSICPAMKTGPEPLIPSWKKLARKSHDENRKIT